MDDDIRALASARVEVDALKAELAEAEKALAISPLVVKCAQLEKRIEDMEMIRRDLIWTIQRDARETFEQTGIAHPHLAVTVTERETPQCFADQEFKIGPRIDIDDDLGDYLTKEEESA